MPTTAPTTAWVLETGTSGIGGSPIPTSSRSRSCDEKMNSTSAWVSTTTKAVWWFSLKRLPPTVRITRWE